MYLDIMVILFWLIKIRKFSISFRKFLNQKCPFLKKIFCILATTQLFFHSFMEKILAKIMVDLFLFAFLRIGKQIDQMLPRIKGLGDYHSPTDQSEPVISEVWNLVITRKNSKKSLKKVAFFYFPTFASIQRCSKILQICFFSACSLNLLFFNNYDDYQITMSILTKISCRFWPKATNFAHADISQLRENFFGRKFILEK